MRGRHINLFIVYSPLFKRVFSFITPLFYIFQYLPLFLVARTTISKKVTLFLCFLLICLILRGASFDHISRTLVGIWPLVFFYKLNFSITQKNMSIFVLLVIFYGLLQRIFGFFPYELFWLETYSNVGAGYSDHYLSRQFSVFAGAPEMCFFMCAMGYLYLKQKRYFMLGIVLIGIGLSLSRAVILSAIVTSCFIYITQRFRMSQSYFTVGLMNMFAYLALSFGGMLIFTIGLGDGVFDIGTLMSRLAIYTEMFSDASLKEVILGPRIDAMIFDNFYLFYYNYTGIFSLLLICLYLQIFRTFDFNVFLVGMWLGVGFYSDTQFQFFMMMNLIVLSSFYKRNGL